jgi:hypothetical protein
MSKNYEKMFLPHIALARQGIIALARQGIILLLLDRVSFCSC